MSRGTELGKAKGWYVASVHVWLADQARSSVPAWLTNPWVAVLGLVSSVVAVLQGIVAVTKWFAKRTDKPSTRKRLNVSLGVSIIASTLVVAPFTWETVAIKAGGENGSNPLWVAEIYPGVVFIPLLICVMYYFKVDALNWKERVTYWAFLLTTVGLVFPTYIYDLYNRSVWEREVVTVTASLSFALLLVTYLAHLVPRAKPKGPAPLTPPAGAEKVT
jgi:cytochrome bd-type quinol oxidase subunit 2